MPIGFGIYINTDNMNFPTPPRGTLTERERTEASNAYLMTLMTVMIGLPFPIINLVSCLALFLMARSKSPFVKFHFFQAMLSQLLIIIMNTIGISWTIAIIWGDSQMTSLYIGYIIAALICNILDYVYDIIGAIRARRGELYSFAFFGTLSYMMFYKNSNTENEK